MNNDIREDYCSFEVSKLLKEKGFKQQTLCFHFEDREFRENNFRDITGMDYGNEFTVEYEELLENWNDNFLTEKNGNRCFGCSKSKGYFETYSAPTHALAIKWIRENFGIHISVDFDSKNWFGIITILPDKDRQVYGSYASAEQATEASLLYTLQKLIK